MCITYIFIFLIIKTHYILSYTPLFWYNNIPNEYKEFNGKYNKSM